MFVVTLAIAGNETTRNSITQGMMAFTDNPDQWELFKAQRPKTAADEIIRWATPITAFQRTALADTELGGVRSRRASGWCCSTARPTSTKRSSTTRTRSTSCADPNPHLGFGGTGAHYCIGANLARMTIDLMFNAIADHMPDLTADGRSRAAAVGLHQRHQALAGRLPGQAKASLPDVADTLSYKSYGHRVRETCWQAVVDTPQRGHTLSESCPALRAPRGSALRRPS